MLNQIKVVGRGSSELKRGMTAGGVPVASFVLRCERGRKLKVPGERSEADFFDVVAWHSEAQKIEKWYHKGDLLFVEGRMKQRWVDGRKIWELNADTVAVVDKRSKNYMGNKPGGLPAEVVTA